MRQIPLQTWGMFVVGVVLSGWAGDRSMPSARAAAEPSQIKQGQALFAKHCVICHGEKGDGQGRFAYLMNPRPRDFVTAKFKLTTTMNNVPTDEDLLRTLRRGLPGSAMPPWAHLPEAELRALIAYIRQLGDAPKIASIQADLKDGVLTAEEAKEEIALMTVPGDPIPVPPEPKFGEEKWFNARRIYLEGCAPCHGVSGEPDPSAELKQDTLGYPVSPRSFVGGVFKGGSDGPQLYARIFKGMTGTPMPAYEGTYSPDQLWSLVHYIQSLAQAGSQERAWLRRGTITAKKVAGGQLPTDPRAAEWEKAPPTYVSLTPLWWRHDRVEGLLVQAMHDAKEIAIRLTWLDPVPNQEAAKAQSFRDGAAIQFSARPDPPFYMGQPEPGGGVTLWYWKADRQKNLTDGYQDEDQAYPDRVVDMYPGQLKTVAAPASIRGAWPRGKITDQDPTYITGWGAGNIVSNPKAKSPVETLEARGPGTLSARPPIDQIVQGLGVYRQGAWYVEMRRTMKVPVSGAGRQNGTTPIVFASGAHVPLSFAVWEGQMGDRDGKKQISIWQELVIE